MNMLHIAASGLGVIDITECICLLASLTMLFLLFFFSLRNADASHTKQPSSNVIVTK